MNGILDNVYRREFSPTKTYRFSNPIYIGVLVMELTGKFLGKILDMLSEYHTKSLKFL